MHPKDLPDHAADAAMALIHRWGWTHPPEPVLDAARQAVALRQQGARRAPAAEITEREKALLLEIPVYEELEHLNQHPAMSDAPVAVWLEQHDAALMLIEGLTPVVLFASLQALLTFSSEGRGERAVNPVRVALGGDEGLLFAMASRDEIAALLKEIRSEGGSNSEEKANLWSVDDPQIRGTDEGRELSRLIDHAIAVGATDIAVEPLRNGDHVVRLRRFGQLMSAEAVKSVWNWDLAGAAVRMLQTRSGANPAGVIQRLPTDGQLSFRSANGEAFLRPSFIPLNHLGESRHMQSVSVRLFERKEMSPRLADIRLSEPVSQALRDAAARSHGLVLVVGPTNSGKSTTIAGAIGENRDMYGDTLKRLSLEDPIERLIEGVSQFNLPPAALVRDDESGGFLTLLRSVLRHDPDVIWVGEIRDKQSAEITVSAAATGHLVFTTLHAKDAATGWDVLAQKVSPGLRWQLIESLSVVTSQRLVKELCPHCRIEAAPTQEERRSFEAYVRYTGLDLTLPGRISHGGNGCKVCSGTGYLGQVAIDEALIFDRRVKDAAHDLLAGDTKARRVIADAMLSTMQQTGLAMLAEGRITLADLKI